MPWTWPPPPAVIYSPTDPDALGLKILSVHVDESLEMLHLGHVHVTQLTPLDLLKLTLLHETSVRLDDSVAHGLQSLRDDESTSIRSINIVNNDLGHAVGSAIATFARVDYFGHDKDMDVVALQSPPIPGLDLSLGAPALIAHGTTKTTISNFHAILKRPPQAADSGSTNLINLHPDLSALRVAGLTATQTPDESTEPVRPPILLSASQLGDPRSSVLSLPTTDTTLMGGGPSERPTRGRGTPSPPKLNRFDSVIPPSLAQVEPNTPARRLETSAEDKNAVDHAMRTRLRTLGIALCAAEVMSGRPIYLDTPFAVHGAPEPQLRPDIVKLEADSANKPVTALYSEVDVGPVAGMDTEAKTTVEGSWAVGGQILFGDNGFELREKIARFWYEWPITRGEALGAVEIAIAARESGQRE